MAGPYTEEWRFGAGEDGRDPRLGLFASGGDLDGALPSASTLGVLEALAEPSGPQGRPFAGVTHDEAAGVLAGVRALEGHVAGLKLAAVREIIRRHAPETAGGFPGPSSWRLDVLHEVAAILRISWQSADPLVDLAWQLEARLPGVGKLLDTGVLSHLTARIIAEEFSVLDGDRLAEAQKLLLEHDLSADDMTPGKIRRLCQRLADAADPAGAAKRREQKQRDEARVVYYRDHGGAAALFATGLPPDDALKSQCNVQKRALEYKTAGIREKMDVLRVLALADLTNAVSVPARLALWRAEQSEIQRTGDDNPGRRAWEAEQQENAARDRYGDRPPFPDHEPPGPGDPEPDSGGPPAGEETGRDEPPFPDEPPDDPGEPDAPASPDDGDAGDEGGPGSDVGGRGGPGADPGTGPAPAGMPDPGLPSLVNLTLPLATVLGQADRPGEAPGYGSVDPALVRKLARAAAESPRSGFCVTFTDENGHAAAHGCARLIREKANTGRNRQPGNAAGASGGTRDGPADASRAGPPGRPPGRPPAGGWDFAPDTARPGPEGGHGSWILALPSGARYRVAMHQIPLRDCDHRYATGAYRPTSLLRHLVEVRDGECTFPGCSQPARDCDFEHATPYHQGGATDLCNAGMRSRRCHRVKQSPGWTLTQPQPGWHQWQAPSGRTYTKGPKDYPA